METTLDLLPHNCQDKKDTRWISAFVEARPSEDYPAHWFFEDVQFLVSLINFQDEPNTNDDSQKVGHIVFCDSTLFGASVRTATK